MLDHERQLRDLQALLAGWLDEPVLGAQIAHRADAVGDDGLRAFKAIRRWTARGDHPADRASALNVVAVTAQHLVVLKARHARATPPVTVTELLAYWEHGGCEVHVKGRVAETYMSQGGGTSRTRMRRLSISWPGDERGVAFDFVTNKATSAFLRTLDDTRAAATS